mmetsp:Transcript_10288/g.37889  ORF Transcript_10288/g.37889 Transcript_10288/m.37889 type:complete len:204 (+) Transcript_10288:1896-2507(+)
MQEDGAAADGRLVARRHRRPCRVPWRTAGARVAAMCVRVRLVEEDKAHHVHEQPEEADGEQLVLVADGRRLEHAFHGLEQDGAAQEDQQQRVDERREHLHAPVAEAEDAVGRRARDVRGDQRRRERRAVEEHVAGVGGEAEGVGEEAVGELHEHARAVQPQQQRQLAAARHLPHPPPQPPRQRREHRHHRRRRAPRLSRAPAR